jgi:type II secretory pathway pseudopilin PulG
MRSRTEGFVLLEAVIALAIIGMMSIALLAATASQVRTADKAALLLTARTLADDRMAMLRTLTYDEMSSVPDSLTQGTFPAPFEDYSWRAEVTPVEDEYDLFTVAVVVSVFEEQYPLRTLLLKPRPRMTIETPAGARPPQGGR